MLESGRQRVRFEGVWPEIDGGRFPIKRTVGEKVYIELDMFADGHDVLAGVILHRAEKSDQWSETPLSPLMNDRWRGIFKVYEIGRYFYTFQGWVDGFQSWRHKLSRKLEAEQDVSLDLLIGAGLVEQAVERAAGRYAEQLRSYAEKLKTLAQEAPDLIAELALSKELAALMAVHPDRSLASTYDKELEIVVDREKARFSTWYELFPRSWGKSGQHGTFQDITSHLPYFADLGFDVLYFPPIHPIGTTFRKGKNDALVAEPGDPGVPWGIGSHEGGHKAIHPELGTLDSFKALVAEAQVYGIEIALDLAFQCSPDHPYVHEHPEWFKKRPDGTIQYAENPPMEYQDTYPLNFECDAWQSLWQEMKSIVLFWVEQGVRSFRVDNPHTKPFIFWEWLIKEVKQVNPEVLFLAEAFTRPKLMYELSKLGFSQSYTYFIWRNSKWELSQYLHELTQTGVKEFFRPNFWPNTHDILHEFLQHGGRSASMIRLILAATLSASYGIYGPPFELCETEPLKEGSEEYLDSEKYQLRNWDLNSPYSLKDLIRQVNQIRHQHPALQSNNSLRFHDCENEQILCYTKQTEDFNDVILTIINLDPHNVQQGFVNLPLESLGIDPYENYQVEDLLSEAQYTWFGGRNYVELNPHHLPAHIFWVKQWEET